MPDEDPLTMTEEERKLVVFPGEVRDSGDTILHGRCVDGGSKVLPFCLQQVLGRREEFYTQTVAYEATLKEKKHQLAFLKNMTQVPLIYPLNLPWSHS